MSEELLLDFLTQNPRFIVYVIGLVDFAKCLSRRVRGHDGRAHANLRAFANVLVSLYATPQSRTSADDLTKCPRQMARIEKSAGAGNLRESFIGS